LPKPLILKNKGGMIMKFKLTVLLATFVVTMGLLLGTSAAQEFTVQVDGSGNNAYGILNLPVFNLETQDTINYDVTFRFEPGGLVYPNPPADFDFRGETVFSAIQAVVDALNSVPEVTTVGPEGQGGTSTFRIPVVQVIGFDWFVNITGTYLSSDWAREGVDVTQPDENATYADFTEVTFDCTDTPEDCDDGLYCNGEETCVDGQCENGPAPCVEGEESCNEDTDSCEPVAQPCPGDLNNDGTVDVDDFTILLEDWGRTDCPIQ
jgi:hypothetical protein